MNIHKIIARSVVYFVGLLLLSVFTWSLIHHTQITLMVVGYVAINVAMYKIVSYSFKLVNYIQRNY